jgi:carbonyl reductase 1
MFITAILFLFIIVPIIRPAYGLDISMRKKIAIVTGANQGIGYFIAQQIVQRNDFATVILACRRMDAGSSAANEIQSAIISSTPAFGCNVVAMELDISSDKSIDNFASEFVSTYGNRLDVLVNNAAIAFKGNDPTSFGLQSRPTVNINYHGTVKLTESMLPYLKRAGNQARVVNVASRSGELRILRSEGMKRLFTHPTSVIALSETMDAFVRNAEEYGERNGYAGTNYGMSKCGIISYTLLMQRLCPEVGFSCMCPGYCKTSMSSFRGGRPASEGAVTASWLATTDNESVYKSGAFFADGKRIPW